VRCTAARALGLMDFPADHGVDLARLAAELGRLAADSCTDELVRMEKEQEEKERGEKIQRPPGMMYGGMEDMAGYDTAMPGAMDDPYGEMYPGMGMPGRRPKEEKEDETVNNRRRLGEKLSDVLVGFTGTDAFGWISREDSLQGGAVKLAEGQAAASVADPLLEQLVSLLDLVAGKGLVDLTKDEFRTKLEEGLAQLNEVISDVAPPSAAEIEMAEEAAKAAAEAEEAAAAAAEAEAAAKTEPAAEAEPAAKTPAPAESKVPAPGPTAGQSP